MRKLMLSLAALSTTVLLAGCNEKADKAIAITAFAFVDFSGENGEGSASHGFDQKQLML